MANSYSCHIYVFHDQAVSKETKQVKYYYQFEKGDDRSMVHCRNPDIVHIYSNIIQTISNMIYQMVQLATIMISIIKHLKSTPSVETWKTYIKLMDI